MDILHFVTQARSSQNLGALNIKRIVSLRETIRFFHFSIKDLTLALLFDIKQCVGVEFRVEFLHVFRAFAETGEKDRETEFLL